MNVLEIMKMTTMTNKHNQVEFHNFHLAIAGARFACTADPTDDV